jgi:hypothetical protein
MFPVKPAAAAAIAGRVFLGSIRLTMGTALLLRRDKRPPFVGVLRAFLEVGVGRVALAKLLVVLKVNRKAAASRPEHLI